MRTNTEKYLKLISSIIQKHIPGAKIILYGSRARQEERGGSDIDVAIDAGGKISKSIMTDIFFEIEESDLPVSYDIVDFYNISSDMQKEIRKEGKLWQN